MTDRDAVVRELHDAIAGARCGYRHRIAIGTAWDGDEGVPWCGLESGLSDAFDAGQAHEREVVVAYIKAGGDESGVLRSYFGLTPAERERVRFGKAIEAGVHHTKGEGK